VEDANAVDHCALAGLHIKKDLSHCQKHNTVKALCRDALS